MGFIRSLVCCLFLCSVAKAEEIKVVTTIPPLYSLAASVLKGVGQPTLLVDASQSPHTFSFSPKDMKNLDQAKIIFWIGPSLEGFLSKPLEALDKPSQPLIDTKGLTLHMIRQEEGFEGHSHGAEDHHEHLESDIDPHIWLDLGNSIIILQQMVSMLSKTYPQFAEIFEKNAMQMINKIEALQQDIKNNVAKLPKGSFYVMHDGYQYFEKAYGFKSLGVITLEPGVDPSLGRIIRIKKEIANNKAQCLFVEPQFSSVAIRNMGKKLGIKVQEIDYMGFNLPLDENLYLTTMQRLAKDFSQCLGAEE